LSNRILKNVSQQKPKFVHWLQKNAQFFFFKIFQFCLVFFGSFFWSRLLTCGVKLFFILERHFGILKILNCLCSTWRHIFPDPLFTSFRCRREAGFCIFNNRLSTRLGSIEHAWHLGYKRLLSLIYHLIVDSKYTIWSFNSWDPSASVST